MSKQFPWEIKLQDTWFEWEYNKFQGLLKQYHEQRRILENMEHDATKPVACRSWTKCYFYGEEPSNQAKMWGEIDQYIKDNTKDGWEYSHLETEQVDVNSDPYDDYENLTDQYTVFAYVDTGEDFKQCEDYMTQEKVVQHLYDEVSQFKDSIDTKLGGEFNGN